MKFCTIFFSAEVLSRIFGGGIGLNQNFMSNFSSRKFRLFVKVTDLMGNESPLIVSLHDLELNDVPLVFTESEKDSDILRFSKTNFDIQNK